MTSLCQPYLRNLRTDLTDDADAFVVLNMADNVVSLDIDIAGTNSTIFEGTLRQTRTDQ
ncbi:MAG: hypothetical protein J7M39_08190 [Anaerolineae bacterium]|nr:hypothetical protein [Anaerolineae bacterium]